MEFLALGSSCLQFGKISSFVGYIWSHTFFKWNRVENYSTAKYDLRMEESRFSHKSPDNLIIDELMYIIINHHKSSEITS